MSNRKEMRRAAAMAKRKIPINDSMGGRHQGNPRLGNKIANLQDHGDGYRPVGIPSHIPLTEYLRLSVLEYVNGDREKSVNMFRDVLHHEPYQAEALFRIAVVRGRADDLLESELLIKRAYEAAPTQYKLLRNYAITLQKRYKHEEALELQRKALVHEKMDKKVLLHDIANSYSTLKQFTLAQEYFDQSVELDPENSLFHYNRALNLQQLGINKDAMDAYLRAIELDGTKENAIMNLASLYRNLDMLDEAEEMLIKSIELNCIEPDENDSYYALIGLYNRWQKIDKSEEIIKIIESRITEKDDDYFGLKADLLSKRGDFEGALSLALQAIDYNPTNAGTYTATSEYLLQLNRDEEAIAMLDRMRIECKDDEDIEESWGLAQMPFGNLLDGFAAYEFRHEKESMVSAAGRFSSFLPHPYLKSIEQAKGKRVLVYLEQGIGDVIQFMRYIPLLSVFTSKIILLYAGDSKAYSRIINGLGGIDEQYEQFDEIKGGLAAFDTHCALMSLPYIFGTTIDTIPEPVKPYIPPELIQEWGQRIGVKTKPRVGLVVSGNMMQGNDYNRSSSLKALMPLISDKAETIMVQRDLRPHDITLAKELGLRHLGIEFTDLMDTAAAFENFDLIVGVETGIMHLSATIGRPTWMLLTTNPDWRYFRHRLDSPFYPSVRLFRQAKYHDWSELAARTRKDLDHYLESLK